MGIFKGFFNGFAEGLAGAIDDIRHQVVEQAWFGQQTTGNIELPQVQAPTIEEPPAQARNGEVIPPEPPSFYPADMRGAYLDNIYDLTPNQQPQSPAQTVQALTYQERAPSIEPPQIEPPRQDMER